jgi:hypothetical protein
MFITTVYHLSHQPTFEKDTVNPLSFYFSSLSHLSLTSQYVDRRKCNRLLAPGKGAPNTMDLEGQKKIKWP